MKDKAIELYQTVWRWHLYAGLVFSPLLVLMAATGSVYLFSEPIESYLYQDLHHVAAKGHRLSPSEQIQAVQTRYPEARIRSYKPPAQPDRSAEVGIRGRESATVFVDPYSGRVLGSLADHDKPMAIVRDLHEKLLAGRIGNWIVELAACWLIVQIVTGLFLWWPRHGAWRAGVLVPRLFQRGRIRWRDLHGVSAAWLSLFLLFWGVTGLAWTDVWGDSVKAMASSTEIGFPQGMFPFEPANNKPQSITRTEALIERVPWATGRLAVPTSYADDRSPLSVEQVLAVGEKAQAPRETTLYFPRDKSGVYTLTALPDDPARSATLHIDQYSGEILADLRFEDYGWIAKAISVGVAVHEGRYLGWPNLALGLVVGLAVIAIALSGPVMWWQRKPRGKLGAPRPSEDFRLDGWVIAVIGLFGIMLPLYGLSLVAVLLLDRLGARAWTSLDASGAR